MHLTTSFLSRQRTCRQVAFRKVMRGCAVSPSLVCWHPLQREAELVLLFSQSSKLCGAASSWEATSVHRGIFPGLEEEAGHCFMSSFPFAWFWFWESGSLELTDLTWGTSWAALGVNACEMWRDPVILTHVPESGIKSSWRLLGCCAARHISSTKMFCGLIFVLWIFILFFFFFFGEGVFPLGFCESLNHDFIACGCQYWNSCLSSSPALPKSLLISLCQGEKKSTSIQRHLWKHLKICYFWILVITTGKWMQ